MNTPGNGFLVPQRFFWFKRWWSALVGVLLLAVVCFGRPALSQAAWRLPKRQGPVPTSMAPSARAGSAHLQEVSPPAAVLQFKAAVGEKLPQLEILEPANGALVGDGSWTLRVKVSEWPLIDGGSLGLGPHLLVMLDGEPPRVLTASQTEMPPLSPGSHRLTVAAAWPWGEVIKSHGAFDQIRFHRAAANPLAVPAPGSAQLFVTSPSVHTKKSNQPVLLDWLLIDAPLQNLREDDASWRLRITVNGESFLVDQQTPLWLSGWRPEASALLWELVDGRGEALNPPFNSIVSELSIEDSKEFNSPWLSGRISVDDLAVLLGNSPPVRLAPQAEEESLSSISISEQNDPSMDQDQDQPNDNEAFNGEMDVPNQLPQVEAQRRESPGDLGHGLEDGEPDRGPDPSVPAEAIHSDTAAQTLGTPNLESPPTDPLPVASPKPDVPLAPQAPLAKPSAMTPSTESQAKDPAATAPPDSAPGLQNIKEVLPPAREVVNPDGTMIRPPSEGVLARLGQGLRRRLGPS